MPRHFTCSLLRTALIALVVLLGHDAYAQIFSTVNHGDEMMNSALNPNSRSRALDELQWSRRSRPGPVVSVPPLPPALGEPLPVTNGADISQTSFGVFAREIFYGPYIISLAGNKLSTGEIDRFATYRATRQKLVGEIQLKFEELSGATPAARTAALNELAARQEEPLRALATEAESLRADLVRTATLDSLDSPGIGLTFRDGEGNREMVDLFTEAYYDDGLSTQQRLLLVEIAHAQPAAPAKTAPEAASGGNAYVYFFPATARIRLPAGLPAPLEEKIHAFIRERESLKTELRAAVLRENYFFSWQRSQQLAVLAGQQAPRFQALDTLAEEIRVGLAGFDYPDQPPQLELPGDLTRRVGNFYARKVEVQRELLNRVRSLRSEFPAARFELVRQGEGLAIVQTATDAKGPATLTEFNASLARRYAAFASESELLRRDIQHYTESSSNHAARTIDQLAADFKRAYAAGENWNRYRDYYRAVLVPGLSPAQRQLLFQAATAELDRADPQPQS